jgi:hypothetical protein
MDTKAVIAAIDAEITRLQTARRHIAAIGEPVRRKGRPSKKASLSTQSAPKKRRKMSAAARAKIAAAQKKRWAAAKKAAKKSAK